ncbi:MAG: hypothetical protein IPL79_13060 [Myxococcales bacterium]|nr:hypothetical protein [Myxococcales bacterium]
MTRLTATIFVSLLTLGAQSCASGENGGSLPGSTDPTDPEPGVPPGTWDPEFSAVLRQSDDSLDLVIRTLREVWDFDLTTAGGDLDIMWYDDERVSEGGYDFYQLTLALDPLSTLEALALHDGDFELVAYDELGFDIGASALHLAMVPVAAAGSWQPGTFAIGGGAGGFIGTLAVTAHTPPSGSVASYIAADGEVYQATIDGSGTNYTVRWSQLAMGMCLMANDCTVHITAGGIESEISMGIEAAVHTTVGLQ